MKKLLCIGLSLLVFFSCQPEFDIDLSGNVTSAQHSVESFDFTTIKLHADIELELTNSSDNYIEVETDENYQKYVLVNLLGQTLDIKRSIAANLALPTSVKVRISVNHVNRIVAWRNSKVVLVNPLIKDSIDLELQRHCEVIGAIECTKLNALIHDNSNVKLSGKATIVNMDINEQSNVKCPNLTVSHLSIKCDQNSSYNFNSKLKFSNKK